MPRKKTAAPDPDPPPATPDPPPVPPCRVPRSNGHDWFTEETLKALLALRDGTLPRERRERRIRFAKRGGRIWYRDSWVDEWLRGGEIHKTPSPELNGFAHQGR